ncbi:hypothetical protein [Streptomyces sp. NPDC018584]|uniref:hypothetical protein n=1 Tax=unclassified Streptomyces TaxID=2593676 RepID=UPI0037A1F4B9
MSDTDMDAVAVTNPLLRERYQPGDEFPYCPGLDDARVLRGTFVRVSRLPRKDHGVSDEGRILVLLAGEDAAREAKPSIFGLVINGGDSLV